MLGEEDLRHVGLADPVLFSRFFALVCRKGGLQAGFRSAVQALGQAANPGPLTLAGHPLNMRTVMNRFRAADRAAPEPAH